MPVNLRALQLAPAAARILISHSHPKSLFTPYLRDLLYLALSPFLLTFITTLVTYSPLFQLQHLQLPLVATALIFLSNILLIGILNILLLPLRGHDLVEGFRGRILRLGLWILCQGIGSGYFLIVAIILVSINQASPSKELKALLGISGTLFTSLFVGIVTLALKTPGPRSHDDKHVLLADDNPHGKGSLPPTPGTKEAVEAKAIEKDKKDKKAGDLGLWMVWIIGTVLFAQVLGELGLLGVAGVAIGQLTLENSHNGGNGNGSLPVAVTGCVSLCGGGAGGLLNPNVVGGVTSPVTVESTTTVLEVVTKTTTTTITMTV